MARCRGVLRKGTVATACPLEFCPGGICPLALAPMPDICFSLYATGAPQAGALVPEPRGSKSLPKS